MKLYCPGQRSPVVDSPLQDWTHTHRDDHSSPSYGMTLGFKPFKVILIRQIVICPVVDSAIQRLNNLYIPIRGLIIFNKRPWRRLQNSRFFSQNQ